MRQHESTDTHQEPLSIGFTSFSHMVLLVCARESARVAPVGFPLRSSKGCKMNYNTPLENWDMIKISGMVHYYLTILKHVILSPWVYGSVKDCFTSLGLPCRDLVAKLVKPILLSKRCLKKLLPMDERSQHSTLVRRRSSFPTSYQSHTYVGSPRSTTSCAFCFNTSESGVLRSPQFENRMPAYQRSLDFQRRDLQRLSSLPPSTYRGKDAPYLGQRQLAQSPRFKRPFHSESRPSGASFPATLFPRTQSNRASVENHSQTGNTQPLFRIDQRVGSSFNFSLCPVEGAK